MLDIWNAAEAGDLARVRELVATDASLINAKDEANCTPLIRATWGKHLDIVAFLIDHGANLDVQNRRGRTALREAMASHDLSIAEVLLRAGADPNLADDDASTPLHSAASMGYRSRIDKLYTPEAHDVTDIPDELNNEERSLAIARLLLERGAKVNAKGEFGGTPLHWAAGWGHERMAALLLDNGADINARDISGVTPLTEARHMGRESMVQFLTERGASGP